MKTKYLIAVAASSLLAGATQAQAGTVIFAPRSFAFASIVNSAIVQGYTEINNGTVGQTFGPGTSTSHSADNYTNTATNAFSGGGSTATANLHDGTVRGSASLTGSVIRALGESRINDTVFFSNNSAGAVILPFAFSFDGRLSGGSAFTDFATGSLSFQGIPGTIGVQGEAGGPLANQTLIFGISNNGYIGAQQGGAFFFNGPDNINASVYTAIKSYDPLSGLTTGSYSGAFVIPTGDSSLGIDIRFRLDCSSPGGICDFGSTGRFGFGALPGGLTISSASGVFPVPSAVPGGVPEPAAWALMLAGFGLVGGAMRRRARVTVSYA